MILITKDEILNWLKKYAHCFQQNMEKNAYDFINIHDLMNQSLLNELIKKDNLPLDYFEKLKSEGDHYIVNVKDSINISYKKLEIIPIQFYHVSGDFYCGNNQLKSLKGCPQSIGGHFYCSNNQLKSLEHCPQSINKNFFCFTNKLTSLEYFPEKINGDSYFDGNKKLLKYKNESSDIYIKEMSDDEFLHQKYFQFWQQFHLIEKIFRENNQILDDLKNIQETSKNSFIIRKKF